MATASPAEKMASEDSNKRSTVSSQRIFGIELPWLSLSFNSGVLSEE
jgi:hypothetical protein